MSAVQEATKSPKVAKVVKKAAPKKAASTQPSHPTFIEMTKAGLKQLNERTGSSRIALLKFIVATYKLDDKSANVHLKMALKRGVKDGSLKQVKGVGSNGSFKLADASKKTGEAKNKVVKKAEGTKVATKVIVKKTATKKPAAKKVPSGEDKPKKNVKKVVKPKLPKPVEEKPVEPVKPAVPVKAKVVKPAAKKPVAKPAKTDVKQVTKTSSRSKAAKKN